MKKQSECWHFFSRQKKKLLRFRFTGFRFKLNIFCIAYHKLSRWHYKLHNLFIRDYFVLHWRIILCYIVTSSVTGWAHTQNDSWIMVYNKVCTIVFCKFIMFIINDFENVISKKVVILSEPLCVNLMNTGNLVFNILHHRCHHHHNHHQPLQYSLLTFKSGLEGAAVSLPSFGIIW